MTRAALAVLTLCAGLSVAQEPITQQGRTKALLEGTHILRRILHDNGFTALESLEALGEEPGRTLLVALGDLDVVAGVPGGLSRFLADGGAVLLASDRLTRDAAARDAIVKAAGVWISGDPLVSSDPDRQCYQGRDFCPFVVPAPNANAPLLDPMAADVATNVPSSLIVHSALPGVRALLQLPANPLADDGKRMLLGWPLFAVGGDRGAGRLLVMADHSVFIYQMMAPKDTGNVEFATNAVRWLADGKRDRVLFLEEGAVQTKLSVPLKSPKITPEEALSLLYSRRNQILVEAETWLAKQEDARTPLEGNLLDAMEARGWGWQRVLFVLLIVATVAGALIAGYRLGVGDRYGPDRSTPLLLAAAGDVLPTGPLAEQRVEALLAAGDVREPLRDLARRWLSGVGLTPPAVGDKVPPLEAKSWWAGFGLRRRLAAVWRLAAGAWPGRITPHSLARWQGELDTLRSAWERGEWRARAGG